MKYLSKGIATLIAVLFFSFSSFGQCEIAQKLQSKWQEIGYQSIEQAQFNYGMYYLSVPTHRNEGCINVFYEYFEKELGGRYGLMHQSFDSVAKKYQLSKELEEYRANLLFALIDKADQIVKVTTQNYYMSFIIEFTELAETGLLKHECVQIYKKLQTIDTTNRLEIEKVKNEFDDCQKN